MLQRLENELRLTGDPRDLERADIIASMLKFRGRDIPLPSVAPVAAEPSRLESQQPVLPSLSELVVVVPDAEISKTWAEKGITNFDFFRFSAHEFKRDENYHGWSTKPQSRFWENVEKGRISSDSTKLEEMLIAVDRTQKPDYNRGRQLYPNDPFGELLKNLRQEGKIEVPRDLRHIPETSRFGISPDELVKHVLPEIAKMLEVDASQVRLPREIEFNVIGNRSHPEWGNTNTWEWMQAKFEDGRRLIGGDSDYGGLTDVYDHWSDHHGDSIGFRPLVVVSPKA